MTAKELFDACQDLERFDVREVRTDYADLVIENPTASVWVEKLDGVLGKALKAANESASKEAKVLAKNFGGIQKEQTLYCKRFEDCTLIIMFWPWQNNRSTTIKMIQLDNEDADKMMKPGFLSGLFGG